MANATDINFGLMTLRFGINAEAARKIGVGGASASKTLDLSSETETLG